MTDDSLNKMVEQFQHSRLKAKHIIDRYKIPIEPDEFFSEYVIFLMKNKNNPAYDKIDNYESYCIKILNHLAFEYNQKESLFSNTKEYSWFNTMKKISEEYGIPLIPNNAYKFAALCGIPSLTTRKAYQLIETGEVDNLRYLADRLNKYDLYDNLEKEEI